MKIKELIVYTNNLKDQLDFYRHTLGLQLLKETSTSCSLKIGSSTLTFHKKEDAQPYHFAFNIPSNKENEALAWLKERLDILPFEGREIADFKSWNARSVYFYDKDLNIVEFISRKNLKMYQEDNFSSASILNISEVGIATTEIEKTFNDLNRIRSIKVFDGNFKRFCAIGNEEGMFILVNHKVKRWFPTDDKAIPSEFEISGDYNFRFENGRINEIT